VRDGIAVLFPVGHNIFRLEEELGELIAKRTALAALAAIAASAPANATVTISTQQTQNMNCSAGVCTPTELDAVLNVSDLESMLASRNIKVEAAVEPTDIDIDSPLSWASTNSLTLDSYNSIHVDQPVAITGGGGLALITNDGGTGGGVFSFMPGANVAMSSLSSNLTINGTTYRLANDISGLASAIAANPGGAYALANNYDASQDGTYSAAPVSTTFSGSFQGLGNTISNLSISDSVHRSAVGLFSTNGAGGTIANIVLQGAAIKALGPSSGVGGIVGLNNGTLFGDHVSGEIAGYNRSQVGGLTGWNVGAVTESSAAAKVSAGTNSVIGGLIGENYKGTINQCFATGSVKSKKSGGFLGGLAGYIDGGTVTDSYATGATNGVTGKLIARVGGLIGDFQTGGVTTSYSAGKVSGSNGSLVGGFIGEYELDAGSLTLSYWDTTTSRTNEAAGNQKKLSGVTGLTTAQLQSGLPDGFDALIWAEDSTINNGLPYLIRNPPTQ
jgi:hypothetical protein